MNQLQVRVSSSQKKMIEQAALRCGLGMSEWILTQIFPDRAQKFQHLVKQLKSSAQKSYVLAEIHDLLHGATAGEFEQMVAVSPAVRLSSYWENYLAAMIEYTANQKGASIPSWLSEIDSLESPSFGTDLESLRLYLLTHSPPCFRRRNIFIDSTIGARV